MDLYEYKQLITKIILFTLPVILVLGSIGNFFSFIIFSRNEFRKTHYSLYFRVLAFTDTFTLLFIPAIFMRYYFGNDIKQTSYFMCKFFNYFLYWVPPISGWILVVVSFNITLSIIKLKTFLFIKKIKIQIAIVFILFVFNSIFYLPLPLYEIYQDYSNGSIITHVCYELEQVVITYWMDLFNSTIVPFGFMLIFSTITLKRLIKSRSRVNVESTNKLKSRDVKFASVSVILNVFFFVLNLPICVYYLVANYVELDELDSNLFYIITLPAYYLNFSVVFYVNLFSNPLFRKELFVILRIEKQMRVSFGSNAVITL